jgi:hypothetical protein
MCRMDDPTRLYLVRVLRPGPGFQATARRVDSEPLRHFTQAEALLAYLTQAPPVEPACHGPVAAAIDLSPPQGDPTCALPASDA